MSKERKSKFVQNPRPNWILFIFDMQKIQFSGLIWILFIFDMQKLRNKEGFFRSFCMSKINKIQINPENWIFCMSKINKSNLERFWTNLDLAQLGRCGLLCPWS